MDVGKLITKAQISQRLGMEREMILETGHGVVSKTSDNLPNQCYLICCCGQIPDQNRIRQEELI